MSNKPVNKQNNARSAEEMPKNEQPVELEPAKPVMPPSVPKAAKQQNVVLAKVLNLLSSVSVRYKIAGTLIIILSLTVISLGVVTFARQKKILRYEMKNRASVLVQQLANVGKEGLLTKQELPVFSTITDIAKRDDVVYAMVVDNEGKVFAHSDFSQKGSVPAGASDSAALKTDILLFQETVFNNDSVMDAAFPITLKANNLKLGVARIGLSEKALNAAIREQKTIYLWMALGFGIGGLLVSFGLARLITKPLDALAEGIHIVSRGDLRSLVAVTSNDEIGKVTGVFNQMILSLREKIHMEKYLSQSTVNSIKEHRDMTELKLGGERKYVTALFSDARGFTSLSEKMSPEEVVTLMNIYLNLQSSVVDKWGGIVDKFVGDEVMAIFEGKGREINAVRAAVEIQSFCKALNAARAAAGETVVNIGIGLNGGDVVMGNMGAEDHMDYTVIGDNINVAARLCGIAQPGQVLVSKVIADQLGDQATLKELPPVMVKGKDKPIIIAEVVAIKGGTRRYMRKDMDVTVTYSLEGFADDSTTAVVKNISPSGCLLEVASPIAIGSKLNINFNLFVLGNIKVRATVYHARKQEKDYFIGLCFEDMQEEVRYSIIKWIHRVNSEIAEGLFL